MNEETGAAGGGATGAVNGGGAAVNGGSSGGAVGAANAEAEPAAQADAPARKRPLAVNRSFSVGILKELPVKAILTDNHERRGALMLEMVALVKREVLPVTGPSF